jgi:CHAT domain-containing protein/tetratricopeptide (TPR) repeat protein
VTALLLVTGALAAADPTPVLRGGEVYEAGARLLDAGQNPRAISLFRQRLNDDPLSIVAADGLLEASQRLCSLEAGLAWLDSIGFTSDQKTTARHAFFNAHHSRQQRDFGRAADGFQRAADASLADGDTLAAAVCLGRAGRCAVAAKDAETAALAATSLHSLATAIEGVGWLAVDADVIGADAANLADRLHHADSLYRSALVLAKEKGYRQSYGFALSGLGKLHEKRQNFLEAVQDYARALETTRALGAVERSAKLLSDLAQSETRAGDLVGARDHFDQAVALVRSCRADWVLGYIYYGLGALEEADGDHGAAIAYFDRSAEHHARNGNAWNETGARLRLAYRYIESGAYPQAIAQYGECLAYYESTGSTYGLGWALAGLALAHHRLGNLWQAEEFYLRTLELRRQLGDQRGVAWCFNALGMVNDMQGNYRQALEYELQAMEIYEQIGDTRGVGAVLFSMGSVYFYLGNLDRSMDRYEKAYAIAKENGDAALLERTVSGIASVYHSAGRDDMAEAFYLEHLELTRKAVTGSNVVWSLNNIASLYIESSEPDKARRCLDEALSLLPERGMDHLRSRALHLAGKSTSSTGDAIEYTERALQLAEEFGLKELQWSCMTDLGQYYIDSGDAVQARAFQERAILQVESLRRGVGSDELRRHMLRPAMRPYERMVSLLVDAQGGSDGKAEAFAYTERAKAQIFAALLKEARDRMEDEGDEDRSHEKELVSRLSHIQSRLQDPSLEEDAKRQLIDQMNKIERDLLRDEIRLAGRREYHAASVYPSQVDTIDIRETIRPNERMLSYFLGQSRSYLFASDGERIDVFVLPDRATIEGKVNFYIRLLRQLASGTAELPASVFVDASEQLFNILVGPAAGLLEPGETLLLLPDGILNRLPFALLRHEGAYLIETYPVYYAPSLRSLYYLRQRAARRAATNRDDTMDLIAVGSSGARDGNGRTGRVYPLTDIPVEALPLAAEEAQTIAEMFDGSLCLTGRLATEQSFKRAPLDGANIVHIAAHSYVDNEDVRRSFIVLNPHDDLPDDSSTDVEDGLLQWHEIAGLRFNASLVTLSACRAAGGVLAYGEGITGLTQAFLYAGGDCVLASFIDVPDRFAGRFMEVFYRQLKSGAHGAEALRAAQLEAAQWNYATHGPSLWGSFALIGDGSFLHISH